MPVAWVSMGESMGDSKAENSASHLDSFRAGLSYRLDEFQDRACHAVEADRGVLVCAPTGAGKTVVGEFAVSLALHRGTKCFYTTPIKALSNQKFHDLVAVYGQDAVGLLTGDQSINPGADVVVMTTEVLRNMIYASSPALSRLSHVVMDEIHFLADRSRGSVWEEIILNLDESVRVIGLSATVSNSEEFGRWLSTVRGDTEVIVSEHRPVPLDQWMLVGRRLYPLFEPGSDSRVNLSLEQAIERIESGAAHSHAPRDNHDWEANSFRSRARGTRSGYSSRMTRRHHHQAARHTPTGRPEVIRLLESQQLLPAIIFIFSRAGCDGALAQVLHSRLVLTSQQEADEIAEIIDAGVADIPREDLDVLRFKQWKAALTRGFAAHHAGMLPAFRHIVEELFVRGLIRAVFATETLALGINMPARTVVLEKLVKFNGESHAELTPGQYTQLTGRAGRRGIDTLGNAVVQWDPSMDPRSVAGLASTRTYPLESTFAPGYNMSVNLLGTHGYDQAITLLGMSFAQFQADGSVVNEARALDRAESRAAELERSITDIISARSLPSDHPVEELEEYAALRDELTAEERSAKSRATKERAAETAAVLARLRRGSVIAMPTQRAPLLGVIVTPANQREDPRPQVISESGWLGRVGIDDFARPPMELGHVGLPKGISHHPHKYTGMVRKTLRRWEAERPRTLRQRPRDRMSPKARQLRSQLRAHPVHAWPPHDREELATLAAQLRKLQREAARLRSQIEATSDTLATTFRRILELLGELGYVDFDEHTTPRVPRVTEEGTRLARIHNPADLLVAQCLRRGIWDDLDPAELAGVVSTCTFENRKEVHGEPAAATDEMATAVEATFRVWQELVADEQRHGLAATQAPEAAFALAMHQWTAGAPLGYTLAAAQECGAQLTPGDFVRCCRQVIDLLEQVAATAYSKDTAATARRAVEAIRRGVVAIGA